MSLSAPASGEGAVSALAYLDVVVLVVAAPIMLLIGVPAVGYLVGAGVWIALRAVGVLIDRAVASLNDPEFVEKTRALGMDLAPGSRADAAKFFAQERTLWGKVIKQANITPQQ